MPPVTTIAVRALENLGGPRIILAAIPGGISAAAREAGVSPSRVSQVLRINPLPADWARLFAQLAGCNEWEVYEQLGQRPPVSPLGPLFDQSGPGNQPPETA
jgi:hypothetical protein